MMGVDVWAPVGECLNGWWPGSRLRKFRENEQKRILGLLENF